MSDVSKTNELIARLTASVNPLSVTCGECGSKPGKRCYGNGEMRRSHPSRESKAERELRIEAADALEAAVRVPVQGEPNDDREVLKRIAEEASVQRLKDSIEEWRKAIGAAYGTFPSDWELEFWHAGYKHGANAMIEHQVSRATVPDTAKQPAGWSTEDRQESKQEAERRWSRPVAREAEQRYQSGCINGFMLGAEWQKARETFISYKAIADEAAEAERDAALAAIERVRAAVSGHPECDCYEEGDVISCGWKSAYASVLAALDGAPEPEEKP